MKTNYRSVFILVILMGLFSALVPNVAAADLIAEANGPYSGEAFDANHFSGSAAEGT